MQVYLAKLSMCITGNIPRETGLSGTTSCDLYQCSLSSAVCCVCVCILYCLPAAFYAVRGNYRKYPYYVTIIIDLCMLNYSIFIGIPIVDCIIQWNLQTTDTLGAGVLSTVERLSLSWSFTNKPRLSILRSRTD